MPITYPLNFPNVCPRAVNIRSQSIVGVNTSPFTGQQQVYKHQGQWWEMEITMPAMKRDDAETLIAFLLKLNGRYGTFYFGDPANTKPRGIGTGTPLVNGASQTGDTLITDGWTPSITNILKAGDWLQIGSSTSSKLHKVLDDVNSDSGGNATLTIWPNLRVSPPNNGVLSVNSPKGIWRLSANETNYSIDTAQIYGVTFACVEAI
jgi:hypothetical protein